MQQYNKLSRDTRPQEQPAGTYPFGKNGIQGHVKGATINEPGFLPSSAQIPFIPMGVLETDRYPIIFSTNNTDSAIGYYDIDNDVYEPILDDRLLPFKLGFNTDRYIIGEVQRNYKGELVGAFTDKHLPPFYLNFDNPQVTSLQDMMLFPVAKLPSVETDLQSGGTLLPGAYYAAVRLVKKDGTETSFLAVSAPKIITGTSGQVTDQALLIKIGKIDPAYENVQVAIISKINGVTSAVQMLNSTPMVVEGSVLYTGAELTETIGMEEILIPMRVYKRVGTMGQLNDALYIADLESEGELKMQPYASLVKLRWHSSLITVDPPLPEVADGTKKAFMHREVYAFYIRYKRRGGSSTPAYHIPGPALTGADLAASSAGVLEGVNTPKFRLEDTIPEFDLTSKSGAMGKWQNSVETYPNTDDYDASAVGGEDLRGQLVRHHRMPSVSWCKQHLYAAEPEYGRRKLDQLGISVENVIIPAEYADEIIGWEIFYAKRTLGNSTVLGQSLLLFGGRKHNEPEFNAALYFSTGGNFSSFTDFDDSDEKPIRLDQSIFHFHGFDYLYNDPNILPTYFSLELKLRRTNIRGTGGVIEDGDYGEGSHNDAPIVYLLDYLQKGDIPTLPFKRIKRIDTSETKRPIQVPNNIPTGKWQNIGVEAYLGGVFSTPEKLIPDNEVYTHAHGTKRNRANTLQYETTFLANLMADREELYAPFTGQSLVRAGASEEINNSTVFYQGDTYISDYSFHTYGWSDWAQGNNADQMAKGTRVVRRFICETASNLYARYEDPGNLYSRYYPKSPLVVGSRDNYLTQFSRSFDPNQFGYNKDANALDDLISAGVFNTYAEEITLHPHRIHRGGKLSRQTKYRSWRTWLPLDYYETQKNMGRIINLEGMDDRLLIHHEHALFLTEDKTKLESDLISVTLGSGDIFQFEPQEGLSSKLGYAGTQHELACVRTPVGYYFVDSVEGHIFVYKEGLRLINGMLHTFFQQFLRLKDQNVFTGNGYTIGYDPTYKRILLTAKNRTVQVANFQEYDPADLATLPVGTIVRKDGRYLEYLGVNATAYNCPTENLPVAENLFLEIPENTPIGTVVGTVQGQFVDNFYFDAPNAKFALEAATGKVRLIGALDFFQENYYEITGKGVNSLGNDPFVLTVNVTMVNQAPVVIGGEVTVEDTQPGGTEVFDVQATDRENNGLTYTLVNGNEAGHFSIDLLSGKIFIAASGQLDVDQQARYELTVRVNDGTHQVDTLVVINLIHINQPPQPVNYALTILDTTPTGEVLLTLNNVEDPENDALVFLLVSQTVPDVFEFDPATLQLKLKNNSLLDPSITPQHQVVISISDQINPPVNCTVTISVIYDLASLAFLPDQASCTGGGDPCPVGWTLSPDGLTCSRTLTEAAVNNGTQINVCEATYPVYAKYGALIYAAGYNQNGTGTIQHWVNQAPWNNPNMSYTEGVLNRAGVWGCTAVPLGEPVGFVVRINVPATKTYYVGMAADNKCRLVVDGNVIIDQDQYALGENSPLDWNEEAAFRFWHIYPLTLTQGVHYIGLEAIDYGVAAGFGAEIYDNTVAELQAAYLHPDFVANPGTFPAQGNHYGNLNLIYSTRWARGGTFQSGTTIGYSCATDGYVLDTTTDPPVCTLIETQPAVISSKIWAKVKLMDVRLNKQIMLYNNDVAVKMFQTVQVPFYPGVLGHVDCGGTQQHYLNVLKSGTAQKNDCPSGVGSIVKFSAPAGLFIGSSQTAVDQLAQEYVDDDKQAFANSTGKCTPV